MQGSYWTSPYRACTLCWKSVCPWKNIKWICREQNWYHCGISCWIQLRFIGRSIRLLQSISVGNWFRNKIRKKQTQCRENQIYAGDSAWILGEWKLNSLSHSLELPCRANLEAIYRQRRPSSLWLDKKCLSRACTRWQPPMCCQDECPGTLRRYAEKKTETVWFISSTFFRKNNHPCAVWFNPLWMPHCSYRPGTYRACILPW